MANIAEITAILDYVESHPDEWYQREWAERRGCGTAYCVAGHAVVRAGWAVDWSREDGSAEWCTKDGEHRPISVAAQDLLGLTDEQADELFWAFNTLEDLRQITKRIANGEM